MIDSHGAMICFVAIQKHVNASSGNTARVFLRAAGSFDIDANDAIEVRSGLFIVRKKDAEVTRIINIDTIDEIQLIGIPATATTPTRVPIGADVE